MTDEIEAPDRDRLWSLSVEYAAGVDRRRYHDVASLFAADGCLQGAHTDIPDTMVYDLVGPAAIEAQLGGLDRFSRTFHQLGQASYRLSGGVATGEVYCTANHVTVKDGSTSFYVMYIRYEDAYVREAGSWRFGRRFLWIDATEQRGN